MPSHKPDTLLGNDDLDTGFAGLALFSLAPNINNAIVVKETLAAYQPRRIHRNRSRVTHFPPGDQ